MTDKEFKAFLVMLMCNDPWPVTYDKGENEKLVKEFADRSACGRGFRDWIHAYHDFEPYEVVADV